MCFLTYSKLRRAFRKREAMLTECRQCAEPLFARMAHCPRCRAELPELSGIAAAVGAGVIGGDDSAGDTAIPAAPQLVLSGTDPLSGADGTITMESASWGTRIGLELANVHARWSVSSSRSRGPASGPSPAGRCPRVATASPAHRIR